MFVSTREMLNQLGDAPQLPLEEVQELKRTGSEKGPESELHSVLRSLENKTLNPASVKMLEAALEKAQGKVTDGMLTPTLTTN